MAALGSGDKDGVDGALTDIRPLGRFAPVAVHSGLRPETRRQFFAQWLSIKNWVEAMRCAW